MAIVEITLYATEVQDGVAQSDSTLVTLSIDDANNDGVIDRDEWAAYTGSPNGQIAGETTPPALWAAHGTGSEVNGTLYTPHPYEEGDDLTDLLDGLSKSDYGPSIDDLDICFLAGTLIATPTGERPVETLRAGDLVLTRDHGPQILVWTSSSQVSRDMLDISPDRRPIRIEAGALGDGLPRRAVEVSAQHRVLVCVNGQEYLISARHLMKAGVPGITARQDDAPFTLVHIACEDHQIVLAEGAAMETFFTGPMALRALGLPQRLSLTLAFPELAQGQNPMTPARPFIRHRDYARLQGKPVQT